MSGAVLKWPLELSDEVQEIGIGVVSLVAVQNGTLTVWTYELHPPIRKRPVQVVGTGHSVPPNADILGGAVMPVLGTSMVWHVIDLTHCDPADGGRG